jgi:hypothetical protein
MYPKRTPNRVRFSFGERLTGPEGTRGQARRRPSWH